MKRIGIVGLGPMGKRHCEAVKMISNAELVAVCDLVEDNVDAIMNEYNVKNGYRNFDKMLEANDLDMLIVATNGPSHAELVINAAKTGIKRILCEKPMATCINDAEMMIQACQTNNVRLTINHARRWMSPYRKLKRLLDTDIIGDIRHITFQMAGGQMGSNGGHFWDLVRFLTGDEPKKIMGKLDRSGTPNPRGNQYVDPGAFGIIIMRNGCRIFFDISEDYGVPFFVEIMGTVGRVLIDEKACKWEISARKKEDREQPFTRRPSLEAISFEGERLNMILSCKDAIVELMGKGNKISCTGHDGLKSLEMTVAVHKSEEARNQFVSFPLTDSDKAKNFMFT